jgi:opacity protein-like surface antigen
MVQGAFQSATVVGQAQRNYDGVNMSEMVFGAPPMKRRLVGVITAAAAGTMLGFPAYAADLGVANAPIAPAIAYNWGGAYVGAHFGGSFSYENESNGIGGFSTDPSGALYGTQFGYNYLLSPNLLLGIEGELAWTTAQGRVNMFLPTAAASLQSDHHWYDTVTGRLGYVQGNTLFFVKGGGAWMDATYGLQATSGINPALSGSSSIETMRSGWTVGGGVEYLLSQQWSAKIEYDYLDFGTTGYNFGIPIFSPMDIDTRVHEVKMGINYHWAPGALLGGF